MSDLSDRKRIFAGLAAEVAFAILPLMVVLIVVIQAGHLRHLFASPEWSFGAAILFGQSLMKFISGLARGGSAAIGPVALAVALPVVFGLVPALLVLGITLQSWEAKQDPRPWLQITQLVLFIVAGAVYMLMGTIGEMWGKPRAAAGAGVS